jgi:tRNA A-37 threonylcarbamoyl transferase component Bud32
VLYNKLNNYFNNSIKLSLKTKYNIFIITKNDIFYEINLENWKLQYFILNNDKNIIECTKVEELCNKGVYDLICGVDQYIARINENKFYFIGKNKLDVNEIISDLNIKDVKCGYSHTLFLTSSGEVYTLGDNRYGQIGSGCNDHQNTPIKVNGFSDERVIMISCGGWHSLALTESGCVYSWGYNECGQLGIGNTIDSNKPILIALEKIIIERISCGRNHSLLLSNEGVIYAFGENFWGQIGNGSFENQVTPVKLNHEIKFTDIAADFSSRISVSLSTDNICYVWGKCKEENFRTPIKTDFGTFAEVFDNYNSIQYKISEKLFEFEDELFRFGYFDRNFEELELLGIGSIGTIVKVREKKTFGAEYFAIKKLKPRNGYEKEFVNEFDKYSLVRHYKNPYIVKHFDAWFENIPDINNERLILYIKMELCETTLKEIIEEIKNDINFYNKNEKILNPIGYYIASQLFIEIVKAIKYLHKKDIIHRDLNPINILIKREEFNAFRIRKSKNRIFVKIGGFLLTEIHEYAQPPHDRVRETLKYLAPEVENDKKFYFKSDIYSLGLLLKELFDIDLNRYLYLYFYYYF